MAYRQEIWRGILESPLATRPEMVPDAVLLAESGVVRETPLKSDQPICDNQPLGLPAGKHDGQIELGCLEMLGQGHSVTRRDMREFHDMATAGHRLVRLLRYIRSKSEWAQNYVFGAGAVVMLDCMTCKWIRWSASIPVILLLSAIGLFAFAHLAEYRHEGAIALLALHLATWSDVLALAGTVLLAGWWLWRWLHMRIAHAPRPC